MEKTLIGMRNASSDKSFPVNINIKSKTESHWGNNFFLGDEIKCLNIKHYHLSWKGMTVLPKTLEKYPLPF